MGWLAGICVLRMCKKYFLSAVATEKSVSYVEVALELLERKDCWGWRVLFSALLWIPLKLSQPHFWMFESLFLLKPQPQIPGSCRRLSWWSPALTREKKRAWFSSVQSGSWPAGLLLNAGKLDWALQSIPVVWCLTIWSSPYYLCKLNLWRCCVLRLRLYWPLGSEIWILRICWVPSFWCASSRS